MPINVESAVLKTLKPIVCGCPKCKVNQSGSVVLQYFVGGVAHVLLDENEYYCKCSPPKSFISFRFFESIEAAKTFADTARRLISEKGSIAFLKLMKAEVRGQRYGIN